MSFNQNIDFVLRTVEERGIRFILLWFTDVSGNLKSLAISAEDLEEDFVEGVSFDGSSVEGFSHLEESDMLAFPDPETFQILPWLTEDGGTARILCNIKTPDREPFAGDPRVCLQRVVAEAEKKGYILNVGPEIEYFYFKDGLEPEPIDHAGYFDLTPFDAARDLRRDTVRLLEKMSVPVDYSYHAVAPSQQGIQLRYSEAVSAADNVMMARHVIKHVGFKKNIYASFMPKPLTHEQGSAMFIQQSLFDHDGNNLFWGSINQDEQGTHLSELAKHYVAGLLAYAPEFSLVTNQTVNSYKRLVPTGEVPYYTTWGKRDRSALVRIPVYKPGKNLSSRIELRSPDPVCNPYLVFAATLAAGIRGIEEKLPLQQEYSVKQLPKDEQELKKLGIQGLPRTLGEAIERFEKSELMREALGKHIFEYLLEEKKREWARFCSIVTEWERKHYYAGF